MDRQHFVTRMKQGRLEQEIVLNEIYLELRQRTRAACRKVGIYSEADIDDITQHTCEALLTHWSEIRGEGSLWGWVQVIARNRAIDLHRSSARFAEEFDAVDDGVCDTATTASSVTNERAVNANHERARCVEKIVQALDEEPPARRGSVRTIDLISFTIFNGADTAALAAHLKCSESAAKERKRYALAKFLELCRTLCGDGMCATSDRG